MFYRRHVDKLLIPIILGLVFVLTSYRAKNRLRPEMPAAFVAPRDRSSASKSEKDIAGAYWKAACTNIQWKYVYGHPLPSDPPPEFQIDDRRLGALAADATTRLLYWRRLQQVWFRPETWTKEYEWDFGWVGDPISSGASWLKEESNRLFQ